MGEDVDVFIYAILKNDWLANGLAKTFIEKDNKAVNDFPNVIDTEDVLVPNMNHLILGCLGAFKANVLISKVLIVLICFRDKVFHEEEAVSNV